jgi:hypothetical protein
MSTEIAWYCVEEIIRRVGVCVLVGELPAIAVTPQIAIEEDLVAENGPDGGAAHPRFAPACMRREDECAREHA